MTVADSIMRHRLIRLERIYPGYSIYFITCCTHERQSLLAQIPIHDAFRSFCEAAGQRDVWSVAMS